MSQENDLRVWWIPQMPMKPFIVPVSNFAQGVWLTEILAKYDEFQFLNDIKPDYCNVGGVQRLENGEWCDYEGDDS